MKFIKLKFITLSLLLCLCLSENVFGTSGLATDKRSLKDAVSVAENFLRMCTNESYLYSNEDISSLTTADFSGIQMNYLIDSIAVSELESCSTIGDTNLSVDKVASRIESIRSFPNYIENKVNYLKTVRQTYQFNRTNFRVEYEVINSEINNQNAMINIYETIQFRYDFLDEDTFIGINHQIELYCDNNKWYVCNDTTDDMFDDTIVSDSFNYAAAIREQEVAKIKSVANFDTIEQSRNESLEKLTSQVNDLVATAENDDLSVRLYDQNLAVEYARIFTTEYNDHFINYTSLGGDCTNFVSQCMYVGLGGSDDKDALTQTDSSSLPPVPMDNDGDSQWYWMKNKNGGDYRTSSWTGARNFVNYRITSQEADIIKEDLVVFGDFDAMMTLSEMNAIHPSILRGSIVVVQNNTHAMIISGMGNSVQSIVCISHTPNTQNASLLDMVGNINTDLCLAMPVGYMMKASGHLHKFDLSSSDGQFDADCNVPGCEYNRIVIDVTTIPQKKYVVGGTNSFAVRASCRGNVKPYRMAAKVERYSSQKDTNGNYIKLSTEWIGEVMNTGTYSKTYTYPGPGLYRVTIYARDNLARSGNFSRSYSVRVVS